MPPLAAREDPFDTEELRKAIKKMTSGKSCKRDDIPIEAFKAICSENSAAFQSTLEFGNLCWATKSIPDEWANASVTMIYKKGDPGSCDNYRPICLLSIALKLFSATIKQRLLDAGVEAILNGDNPTAIYDLCVAAGVDQPCITPTVKPDKLVDKASGSVTLPLSSRYMK